MITSIRWSLLIKPVAEDGAKQPMKRILAIDTSTDGCSVALAFDGATLERFEILPRGHANHVLPMVQALLAEAGTTLGALEAIAFCQGPGSFTGVRVATSVVQGLAFAVDLPVAPVSTLAALAQGAWHDDRADAVLAALDARMGEVYWGCYRLDGEVMVALRPDSVVSPALAPIPEVGAWFGVGSGWRAHEGALVDAAGARVDRYDGERVPRALHVLPLALAAAKENRLVDAAEALPVYLRDRVTR